jgi:hypothetical protein
MSLVTDTKSNVANPFPRGPNKFAQRTKIFKKHKQPIGRMEQAGVHAWLVLSKKPLPVLFQIDLSLYLALKVHLT